MNRTLKRAALLAGSLTMAAFLAGCSDSTGPSQPFDPQSTASSVDEVVSTFEANQEAFTGMSLASQALGASLSANLLPRQPGQILPATSQAQALANDLTVKAIFPSNFLGVTFVWDSAQAMYVPSDHPGAPSNGVRVIYYAVDPTSGEPAAPLNALGYVDLTDQTSASSVRLGIKIVKTGDTDVTLADYYVDASYTQTSTDYGITLASKGYVSNGTQELDFDLSETLTLSQTNGIGLSLDYQASLKDQGVSVQFQATGTITNAADGPSTLEATFTLQNGNDKVVLTATLSSDNTIDGSLAYNGDTVMNIGGTSDNPTFTKPDGSDVTQSDLTALKDVWDGVGKLFDFVGQMFGPASA